LLFEVKPMEADMKSSRKSLMTGIAAVALTGICTVAIAGENAVHSMTVALPEGGTAVIQYTGAVAPKVNFDADPVAAEFFGPASPFAAFQRLSAQMNLEMAAMMRQADAVAMQLPRIDQPLNADLRNLPAGVTEYSIVSTTNGNGFCSRSMEITSIGNGQKPKVVTRASGDCGDAQSTMQQSGEKPDSGLTTIKARQDQTMPRANQRI
jgi:hypothetical protein